MPFAPLPVGRLLAHIRQLARDDTLILSALAMIVGATVGGAVILFRETVLLIQYVAFGSASERLSFHAADLPWWQIVLAPTVGGLLVGVIVYRFMPGRRPQGVADTIEACALRGGRMDPATGLLAAAVSALSIGVGASVGREGPAVHLGGALGSWFSTRLHLSRNLSRTLLGCGAAAAVAASFNAPIAGALFANEVVIGHYALTAFAPVVIASVVGFLVSRAFYGDFPAFSVMAQPTLEFWEFPAIIGLGIAAGIAAAMLGHSVRLAQQAARRMPGPQWLRPAVGGLAVGVIGVPLPQVLGIGYGVTETALAVTVPLALLVAVGVAKLIATGISLGFGFGGGVFSPSLVIGAMLGGAYGIVATAAFPDQSAGPGAYTLIGMGAVAAAALGAPISTTLIIMELTDDYTLTIGVLLAVVVATLVCRPLFGRSFFHWQLRQRGLDLHGGFQTELLRNLRVAEVMSRRCELVAPEVGLNDLRWMLQHSAVGELFVVDGEARLVGTVTLADLSETAFDPTLDNLINAGDVARRRPPVLELDDDLEAALALTRTSGEAHIAVIRDRKDRVFAGCLHERDAMAAYNRALLEARREEHL